MLLHQKKGDSQASVFLVFDLANEAEISDLRKEVNKIDNKTLIEDQISEIKEIEEDVNIKSIKKDVNDIKNVRDKKI